MSDLQPADSMASPPVEPPISESAAPGNPAITTAGRTLAEWLTFIVATLILVGLVILVVYDWQVNQNRPPAFHIEVAESARMTDDQYYVPFTITNTGGQIARAVQIIAELHLDDGMVERGEQQIDFLSGNEQKQGSFVFTHDLPQGDLVIRVASYGLP